MTLREEYKSQTRARILEAVRTILGELGEHSITIAAVAARAGVTVRTIYRHFETRDGLLQAACQDLRERVESLPHPLNGAGLVETPLLLFPKFDDEPQLARASIQDLAARSNKRQAVLEQVRRALPNLDENSLRRRAAVVELLLSVYAWDGMRRLWGFDGVDSGDAAHEALQVLLDQREADQGST